MTFYQLHVPELIFRPVFNILKICLGYLVHSILCVPDGSSKSSRQAGLVHKLVCNLTEYILNECCKTIKRVTGMESTTCTWVYNVVLAVSCCIYTNIQNIRRVTVLSVKIITDTRMSFEK